MSALLYNEPVKHEAGYIYPLYLTMHKQDLAVYWFSLTKYCIKCIGAIIVTSKGGCIGVFFFFLSSRLLPLAYDQPPRSGLNNEQSCASVSYMTLAHGHIS